MVNAAFTGPGNYIGAGTSGREGKMYMRGGRHQAGRAVRRVLCACMRIGMCLAESETRDPHQAVRNVCARLKAAPGTACTLIVLDSSFE